MLAFGSLPFLANGRIGELGASQLDDLSFHMGQADALREIGAPPASPRPDIRTVRMRRPPRGGGARGWHLSRFTGLLLAVPALTALTALAAFEGVSARLRLIGAVLVGLPYLTASYVAMGAFKEPILALCFLGFVLALRDARAAGRLTYRHAAAWSLTTAGGVADFGMAALAWPAGALIWLGVMEGPRRVREAREWALRRPRVVWALAGGAAVGAVACLALAAWSSDFFSSGPGQFFDDRGVGGNFRGQLSPLEALGMWPAADFRFSAAQHRLYAPGIAVGIAVTAFGALWCWRRRELVLLSGALAGLSIYLVARPFTLAYFSGKALAVWPPCSRWSRLRGLCGAEPHDGPRAAARRAAWAVAAASFTLLAGYSSALALRGAHVRPKERGPGPSLFRPIIRGEPTLYLGRDDYAGWELRGDRNVRGFQPYSSPLAFHMDERPEKAACLEAAVDVDSVDPSALNTFRYLVSPRTAYASQPPANFKPIRKSRWYVLWERRGPRLALHPRRGRGPGRDAR